MHHNINANAAFGGCGTLISENREGLLRMESDCTFRPRLVNQSALEQSPLCHVNRPCQIRRHQLLAAATTSERSNV